MGIKEFLKFVYSGANALFNPQDKSDSPHPQTVEFIMQTLKFLHGFVKFFIACNGIVTFHGIVPCPVKTPLFYGMTAFSTIKFMPLSRTHFMHSNFRL